jgi:hypothetical protein
MSVRVAVNRQSDPVSYHFKGIQFLLDLLRQHGSKTIGRSSLATTVILLTRPGVVENDAGAEGSATFDGTARRTRSALSVLSQPEGSNKVVFVAHGNGACAFVSLWLINRGAWSTGVR